MIIIYAKLQIGNDRSFLHDHFNSLIVAYCLDPINSDVQMFVLSRVWSASSVLLVYNRVPDPFVVSSALAFLTGRIKIRKNCINCNSFYCLLISEIKKIITPPL